MAEKTKFRLIEELPRNFEPTRFGDGAYTRGLVRFTWHALSLMLTATGAVLIALAQGAPAGDRGQVAFLMGTTYAAAAFLLAWMTRRRPVRSASDSGVRALHRHHRWCAG
jgi:hypothetical protein